MCLIEYQRYLIPVFIALVFSPLAQGGELRPLNLPSTQRPYTVPQQTHVPAPAPVPVAPVPAPQPTVYDRFRGTVEGLEEPEKEVYRARYRQSLQQAESRGDSAAAAYYRELLSILDEG